ncbi:ribose-phosphate pyrophosphokinase [Candidatus Micrarchaeota archaeon]|nr:ribose-phosphate pyrophosphokinase [Candidatus Micrarchaeota archaeon]
MPLRESEKAVIVHGTSHPELAKQLSKLSGMRTIKVHTTQFANKEIGLVDPEGKGVAIEGSVRRKHVFLVQSPSGKKLNDNLMETFIIASALRRHGASEVTLVMPHFPYARQERISVDRGPVSAKLLVDLLHASGIHNMLALDLHAKAIQGFTPESFENISALSLIRKNIRKTFSKTMPNAVFVATDAGSAERNRKMAHAFGTPYGLFEKTRTAPNQAEVTGYVGPELKGKHVVILEDMIDTGGTLLKTAEKLVKEMGAKSVTVYATHGVFSPDKKTGERAQDKINKCPYLKRVVVTDSLPVQNEGKISVIPIAPLMAKILLAHHRGSSISEIMRLAA